jgi:NitT/TauT family transport system ATP-binding protein
MTARRVERMRAAQAQGNAIDLPLTHVSPNQISGLIEALSAAPYNGKADLPDIAYEQELEVDELFPVAEAMQLLRLAEVEGGDIKLTHMGKRFADGELNERKEIFSRSLMGNVPLAAHIRKVLDERKSHSAPKTRFLDELEDHMPEDAAEETLKTVVSWARFSELFSYDDDAALFSLENPT